MMNLQDRIDLFAALGLYLKKDDAEWINAKENAFQKNPWFTPGFIDTATQNIITHFLDQKLLQKWTTHYHLDDNVGQKNVGIVMAGNIPMVGFHDLLSVFISGHAQTIKLSSKDDVLIKFLVNKLYSMDSRTKKIISIAENLKGCDAYIATGSNNSSRYFAHYFSKYPNIIRNNKTSVAIIRGNETVTELEKLSDDIHLYFGLGCRNVTKIFVPRNYDFVPLLQSFNKYAYFRDHNKYANNYDYQLSILLLNNVFYMTNGSTLLVENKNLFSPISVVHYETYDDDQTPGEKLKTEDALQCTVGKDHVSFGCAQNPGLFSYADGVDSMQFLLSL